MVEGGKGKRSGGLGWKAVSWQLLVGEKSRSCEGPRGWVREPGVAKV